MRGHVGANDRPTSRCSENHKYNPYKYSECPRCFVKDGKGYWLGCPQCGNRWLSNSGEEESACPKDHCGWELIEEVISV